MGMVRFGSISTELGCPRHVRGQARFVGNLSKAVRPVIAATGEDLHRRVSQMDLNTVTVELDFVDPALA